MFFGDNGRGEKRNLLHFFVQPFVLIEHSIFHIFSPKCFGFCLKKNMHST